MDEWDVRWETLWTARSGCHIVTGPNEVMAVEDLLTLVGTLREP